MRSEDEEAGPEPEASASPTKPRRSARLPDTRADKHPNSDAKPNQVRIEAPLGESQDQFSAGEKVVRAAAQRGARSASSLRQVVEDAAEEAVMRWREKLVRGCAIGHLAAWAFTVGANAAKRMGKRRGQVDVDRQDFGAFRLESKAHESWMNMNGHDGKGELLRDRQALRAELARQKRNLTRKQFVVALKLCEAGMSLHRAAAELGMDRSNLRGLFKRALMALRKR